MHAPAALYAAGYAQSTTDVHDGLHAVQEHAYGAQPAAYVATY
jgi:hypothetical protein